MPPSDLAAALLAQWPLALAWTLYAAIHSLTATAACKSFVKRHRPDFFVSAGNPPGMAAGVTKRSLRWSSYRLAYNLVATLLLLPVLALSWRTPGPQLWAWQGALFWLSNGFAAGLLLLFLKTGRGYDLAAFLGLRPEAGNGPPRLVISHWHRFVRHPWYSLGLALIWTRDMNAASLVSASMITLYFIVGSRLEERKLIAEFGPRYVEYRQRVPGLLPRPWRVLSKADAERLAG